MIGSPNFLSCKYETACKYETDVLFFIYYDVLFVYAIFFMLGVHSFSLCDSIYAGRVFRWYFISMRQVWDQPDGIFEQLVSLPFQNKPLMGVIISQEILPRIFALAGSFQFSATLRYILQTC